MSENKSDVTKNRDTFQILSLSGGGVRGLYSIQILAQLEEYLAEQNDDEQYNIAKHFDLICGTSIGGILALALSTNEFNARELLKIFDECRKDIFPRNKWVPDWYITNWLYFKLQKIWQIFFGLYSTNSLKKILDKKLFKEKKIGDLKKYVLIPAVNYSKGGLQMFKTPHHINFKNDWKLSIGDVALATSAAPTYFPIYSFNNSWYVDGGLVANSPCLLGVHEAKHFISSDRKKDIKLLSIGTMSDQMTADQSKWKRKGYLGWSLGQGLLGLTFSSNEGMHKYMTMHSLGKDNVLFIDDFMSPEQASILSLHNAADSAAESLKARGLEKAKEFSNDKCFNVFTKHIAPPPTFHYGPNKTQIHQD